MCLLDSQTETTLSVVPSSLPRLTGEEESRVDGSVLSLDPHVRTSRSIRPGSEGRRTEYRPWGRPT